MGAADRDVTATAAHEWEPWTEDREGKQLPTSDEWLSLLGSIRMAWKTCFLTKPELTAGVSGMSREAFGEYADALVCADALLTDIARVVSVALARAIVAGASAALTEPEA